MTSPRSRSLESRLATTDIQPADRQADLRIVRSHSDNPSIDPGPTTTDWITAGGTVMAALGTVGALLFASSASRAASRSADAARDAVKAEHLPLLLDVPLGYYDDGEHEYPWPVKAEHDVAKTPLRGFVGFHIDTGTFSVPVRNVGRSLARITGYELALATSGESFSRDCDLALPAGEELWVAGRPEETEPIRIAMASDPSPLHGQIPLIFRVTYTDLYGDQRQVLEMYLGGRGGQDRAWRVLSTRHRRG